MSDPQSGVTSMSHPGEGAGSAAAWLWGILLVAGQAASLALVEAGPTVTYQHYRWPPPTSPLQWLAVAVLIFQAAAVLAIGRRALVAAWRWLHDSVGTPMLLFVLSGFVLSAAVLSKNPIGWATELVAASGIQLVALGNAILLGRRLSGRRLGQLLGGGATASHSCWRDPVAWVAAGWVLATGAFMALVVYQNHPHVPDEVAYLFQARYFAEGALWVPAPAAPLAFNLDLLHYDATRVFTPTPPGWPAVLALGITFGVPWLVNPLLGAACVLLAYRVLSGIYDRPVARLAIVLLATSPWFVFMSMNFMTHQATLCMALLAAVAVSRMREARARGTPIPATVLATSVLGGLAIGAASIVRPLEGLAIALLLGFWSLPAKWWVPRRDLVAGLVPSLLLTVGAAAGGSAVRPYNKLITGDASYFPIMAYIDKYYAPGSNDLGFGANRGLGWSGLDPFPGHGLADVVVNSGLNIAATNIEWLGWATGSLLVILLFLGLRRLERADWWQVAVIGAIVGIHSFYWFSGGPDFGARYWFLIIVPCAALTARGLFAIGERLPAGSTTNDRWRVPAVGLCLVAASWLTFVPWRAMDKYHHYRGMEPGVRSLANERAFGKSLVFVRGQRHPDYASAAAYNPLDLTANSTVYAWDGSPEARDEALQVYADRPVYFIDGPTVTKDGFVVVAGPLTHAEAAAFPRQ